ncbi:MAG: DNA-binding protein [Methylococcus sp.]|nr:DNA-binding protein [Methylococcus sp.]
MDHKQMGPAELARLTGIPVNRWKQIRIKNVRASTEELDVCVQLWPEYAYWLITGMTQPEVGNISPEIEETRKKLAKAGGSPNG